MIQNRNLMLCLKIYSFFKETHYFNLPECFEIHVTDMLYMFVADYLFPVIQETQTYVAS